MRFKGFDVSINEINLVDDIMKKEFLVLNELKKTIKKHKRGVKEHTFLMKQIQGIKFSLSSKQFKIYQVNVKQKENFYYQAYAEYPNVEDIQSTLTTFKSKLRHKRRSISVPKIIKKSILGYNYEMIGGVFNKTNSIIGIQNNTDQMARIQTPKKPAKEFKSNYIGVELEMFCKLKRDQLLKLFVDAKLAGYVYVKDDGSLRPEDNYYPHEVTILCKQDVINDIIPRITKVLRSKECDAAVNNSCGMHVHIDVRNRDPYKTYTRLVNGLPLLTRLVPKDRTSNRYCLPNETSNLGDFYRDGLVENGVIANRDDRYKAINPISVATHNTIEVRLHSGTLNAVKIINWIDICVAMADTDSTATIHTPENFFDMIKSDQKLLDYMLDRVCLFDKGPKMDTKADFILDIAAGF